MAEFVHLHNHSDSSLLKASTTVETLIAAAQELGQKAIALTDDGNLFASLRFYKKCMESLKGDKPVRPIIGVDFFVALDSRHNKGNNEFGSKYYRHLLLAKNSKGYHRLSQLSSLGYTEGFYYRPRIDRELIQSHSNDLIALSGGIGGEIPQLLSRNRYEDAKATAALYAELYGQGNFYLELTDHGITEQKVVNEGLLRLSKELGLPLVATNDTYYAQRSDSVAHDILLCIGNKRKRNEAGRFRFSSDHFYIKSAQEMESLFGHIEGALSNTLVIAEQCSLDLKLPGPLLPDYEVPQDFISRKQDLLGGDLERLRPRLANEKPEIQARLDLETSAYFVWVANDGLRKRYGKPGPELLQRLDYELSIIIRMDFVGYFLIVADFINWAKDQGIPVGPGRGSGAGSIVAYSMRITDIDPIRYKLLFERFLNPERVSMPDFDIDFCFERRQEVIDYVTRKYGDDRVGQIITFGTLKAKAAIRDVARVLDISIPETNAIAKLIPEGPAAAKLHLSDLIKPSLDEKWAKAGFEPAAQSVREVYARGEIFKELFDISVKVEGLSRHASTHAAGIVIGKSRLTDYVPLFKEPRTGAISTQFTMDLLEECGLVKMDFLGLKTLTLITNTVRLIQKTADPTFTIETIAEDDAKTFKMLGEGRSSAVFQFDGDGMQATLKRAKPTCIEDLIALNALYRPGPLDYIPKFIDCKWGREPVTFPHPSLKDVLKETYGIMVYQEQVMEAVQIVGGYTLGGADLLRRAMGKKKPEEMAKHRSIFAAGAAEKHGLSEKQAGEIFDILEKFAGYGFNKSHAAAYSLIAYQTAYLKANFPQQFMAANLTNEINTPDKFRLYLSETRAMGIDVVPPDINTSDFQFTVENGRIVFGLIGVKGIGTAVVDEIMAQRAGGTKPFASLDDFLDRVDLRTINRKSVETLILAGCFDRLIPSRKGAIEKLDNLISLAHARKESKKFGQSGLFDDTPEEEYRAVELSADDFDMTTKLKYEKELLGNYFSGHPLDAFRNDWERATTLDLSRPAAADPERLYGLVAMLVSVRHVITKKGKRMAIAQFEDYNGSIEAVFFPASFDRFGEDLIAESILGLMCKVDFKGENPQLIIEEIRNPSELPEQAGGEVHIRILPDLLTNPVQLKDLRGSIVRHSGSCPVFLHVEAEGRERILRAGSSITMSSLPEKLSDLRAFEGVLEVWKVYPAMLATERKNRYVQRQAEPYESSTIVYDGDLAPGSIPMEVSSTEVPKVPNLGEPGQAFAADIEDGEEDSFNEENDPTAYENQDPLSWAE